MDTPMGIDPVASRRIFLGMLALLGGAALSYNLLKKPAGPPPAEIAGDPLLVEGRQIYLARCVSCHGESGRGDGPIAKGLAGPVGDLTVAAWKHGDRPEQVVAVVSAGVGDKGMPGWAGVLSPRELRATSAYVYQLAGRPVPAALRAP
jgi:cytochrome c oxidase cbb3-type subunit 3